jgi:hypothetical protein
MVPHSSNALEPGTSAILETRGEESQDLSCDEALVCQREEVFFFEGMYPQDAGAHKLDEQP